MINLRPIFRFTNLLPKQRNNSVKIQQFPLVFLFGSRLDEHRLPGLVHQNHNRIRVVFDHFSPFFVSVCAECGVDVPVLIDVLEDVIVLELSEVVVHEDVRLGISLLQPFQNLTELGFRRYFELLVVNLVILWNERKRIIQEPFTFIVPVRVSITPTLI